MKSPAFYIIILLFSWLCLANSSGLPLKGVIDLNNLENYANQPIPDYIAKDNTPAHNPVSNAGATLGRVLFYDKQLSVDNSTACASCHIQQFAFSDTAQLSLGRTGGRTGRHSMRLINARFADEERFFWDERASSVEDQASKPIQDHVEMGFSGANGDPGLDSLFNKMEGLAYYQKLFTFVYGDTEVSEERIQLAIAQFVRSIQSFDSKFDEGRSQVANDGTPFPNFTTQENQGKRLFLQPPQFDLSGSRTGGGLGCNGCHRAPEFDIDPNSRNNNVIAVAADPGSTDLTNTRSPSLRDLFNPAGILNGPLMHNGTFTDFSEVLDHYNHIELVANNNLDHRLIANGQGQMLNITQEERNAITAFMQTLSGQQVYANPIWSNPFDENNSITIIGATAVKEQKAERITSVSPNPTHALLSVSCRCNGTHSFQIFDLSGKICRAGSLEFINGRAQLSTLPLANGTYLLTIQDKNGQFIGSHYLIRHNP